jgi:hypothetical protein
MHNEYGLTWLDSVDVEAMSPTQVSRWTMYARYGFMELRIKEAVWRFESVYASIFDTMGMPDEPSVVAITFERHEKAKCKNKTVVI